MDNNGNIARSDCHVVFEEAGVNVDDLFQQLNPLILNATDSECGSGLASIHALNGSDILLPPNGDAKQQRLQALEYIAEKYNNVSIRLFETINEQCDLSSDMLIFSGWSRGGAMASVASAAYYLQNITQNISMVTFGAYRSLDEVSSDAVHGKYNAYRVVSKNDLVAALPIVNPCKLKHFGTHICDHCEEGRDHPVESSDLDGANIASLIMRWPYHYTYPPQFEFTHDNHIQAIEIVRASQDANMRTESIPCNEIARWPTSIYGKTLAADLPGISRNFLDLIFGSTTPSRDKQTAWSADKSEDPYETWLTADGTVANHMALNLCETLATLIYADSR